MQDPDLFTLPRGLADLVSGSLGKGTQYPLKLGAALLATIPVAVLFLIFQRYFVRGANEGADKGERGPAVPPVPGPPAHPRQGGPAAGRNSSAG
ncbi:hypothetical protein V2I01_23420 [Micromonospora sp. BRA006-A]|nr:hypothetical protein [Micromonospora sp. BRA006-A]